MNKKAFTVVELIITILILTIIGTIAVLTFAGYSKNARDSVRLSDIGSMVTAMEIYKTKNLVFPEIADGVNITYSGATAWVQGIYGEVTFRTVGKISTMPVDPLTRDYYAYSLTNDKKEYQISSFLESGIVKNPFITKANAEGESIATAFIKGNYNGVILKVSTGSITYVLASPSIITSNRSSTDIGSIYTHKQFVYNGFSNLSGNFSGGDFNTNGGFDFSPSNYVLIETNNINELNDYDTQISFIEDLQSIFNGTVLENKDGTIKSIMDLDTTYNQSGTIRLSQSLLHNYISKEVVITGE